MPAKSRIVLNQTFVTDMARLQHPVIATSVIESGSGSENSQSSDPFLQRVGLLRCTRRDIVDTPIQLFFDCNLLRIRTCYWLRCSIRLRAKCIQEFATII
jgi:hypothetical protein